MQDSLQWTAHYSDGSYLKQIEADAKNAYEDIDRGRLSRFILHRGVEHAPVFMANFDADGHKLIWRRRVQKLSTGEELVVHVVGKKHQYVALVSQGGGVLVFDNFNEQDALLTAPQLLPQEQ